MSPVFSERIEHGCGATTGRPILKSAEPIPVKKVLGREVKDEFEFLRSPYLARVGIHPVDIHPFVTVYPDGRKVYTAFVNRALAGNSLLDLLSAISPQPDFGRSIGMVVGDWAPMYFQDSKYDGLRHLHGQMQPHWGDFVDVHAGYFIDALNTNPHQVLSSIMWYPQSIGIKQILTEPEFKANKDTIHDLQQKGIHLEKIDRETLKINYHGKAEGIFTGISIMPGGWGCQTRPIKWETAVSLLPVIQIGVDPTGQRQFILDLLKDPRLIATGRNLLDPEGVPEHLQNPVGRLNSLLGFLTALYYSRDKIYADQAAWRPKQRIVEYRIEEGDQQGGMNIGPAQIPVAALRRREKVMEKAEIVPALIHYTDQHAVAI